MARAEPESISDALKRIAENRIARFGPESLINALKRIGFPDVKEYTPDEFESMFADKELAPILEQLCSMTEENVLSSEELAEYEALSPKELDRLEKLAERPEAFETRDKESEEDDKMFLLERLANITKGNIAMEKSQDLLQLQIQRVEDQTDKQEEVLFNSEKEFESLSTKNLPRVHDELISILHTIYKLILEIKNLITDSEYDNDMPLPNVELAEDYIKEEEQMSNYLQDLVPKIFEIEDIEKDTWTLKNVPGHQKPKIIEEVKICHRKLLDDKVEELKAASEKEKLSNIVDSLRKCEDALPLNISNLAAYQIGSKLEEENECNEKLIAKEKLIHVFLKAAVEERVAAQSLPTANAHLDEVMQFYKLEREKLQGPMEKAIECDSRLKLITSYLNVYADKFANIMELTERTSKFVEKEKEVIYQRMDTFKKDEEKKIPQEDNYLTEDSVFLSVFKILKSMGDDQTDISSVTMDDVLQKVEKQYKQKEVLEDLRNQRLNILNSLENQKSAIEKLIIHGKEFADLSEMEMQFNTKFNKMKITCEALKGTLQEIEENVNTKTMLHKNSTKLKVARLLYIYALLDRQKFEQGIENIKTAAINSEDYDPSQL